MLELKPILLRMGLCILIYFGLLLLFMIPPLDNAYGRLFTGVNKTLTSWTVPNGFIEYQPPAVSDRSGKARIVIGNQKHIDEEVARIKQKGGNPSQVNVRMGDFTVNYRQTSLYLLLFLWSLILITPASRNAKIKGMAIGTLVLFLFVAFRIYITLLVNYHNNPWLDVVDLTGLKLSIVSGIFNFLNFGITMIIVIIIWMFTMFRKENYEQVMRSFGR